MRRYLTKTHNDKEIRELELKVDQFFGVLAAIKWVDALMRSTDLIYEIRFLLRVHKWDEGHWKHKHLSAMIRQIESEVAKEEKERANVKPVHTPPPPKTNNGHIWAYFIFGISALVVTSMAFVTENKENLKLMENQGYHLDSNGDCYYRDYSDGGKKVYPGPDVCKRFFQ